MSEEIYDYLVIGAGVVGAAIARELAGVTPAVALVDARDDVTDGTSKANTAILHTGYDAKPGTLEGKLVARGYELTNQYCQETDIGVLKTGAILVAWDQEQAESLPGLQEKAEQNGYFATEIISPEEVYRELPRLGEGVTGGLRVPGESVIDAWSVPLAYATEAVARGATLFLDHQVQGISVQDGVTVVKTNRSELKARWVVNAAGLYADEIDEMFGYHRLEVHPRKGELFVFDKLAAEFADKIVLAAPSKVGKGVLISPTIFGNIMLGPTADDMEDKTDTSTTEEGFEFLRSKGAKIMPDLLTEEVTSAYAGLRAANNQSDYLIDLDAAQRYVIAGAIRSTGLTSALAVAEYILGMLAEAGVEVAIRDDLPAAPVMPRLGEHQLRPYQDNEKIQQDPEYGTMVCFCERVTRGEIRDAMHSTIPAHNLKGLRRRTRAMNGRCQGFFCGAEVERLFNEQKGK
ncbi:MAG: NAD(P)/FAD-dependent oxidoreductase [Trueperella sp.]|nr:NAD(P)/FAD-dependent oxidoreductase [Trueperella sp.]